MTSTPMSRDELLELAALDAFGLLDEYESALYTRSFHHAQASLQDEIRALQGELVADRSLLPSEEPPYDLRERVLAAVATAVAREAEQTIPMATFAAGSYESHSRSRRALRFASPANLWRAAALVAVTCLVGMSYLWGNSLLYNQKVNALLLNRDTEQHLDSLVGVNVREYIGNPHCRTVAFRPEADDCHALLMLYVNEKRGDAVVLALGLPPVDGGYTMRCTKEGGKPIDLCRFASTGAVLATHLTSFELALLASSTFELVDASGNVIMKA